MGRTTEGVIKASAPAVEIVAGANRPIPRGDSDDETTTTGQATTTSRMNKRPLSDVETGPSAALLRGVFAIDVARVRSVRRRDADNRHLTGH